MRESINWVFEYNRIPLSNKKEQSTHGSQNNFAELEKPDTKKYILYDSTDVKS